MKKENSSIIAKPAVPLILLGCLKGYIKGPVIFLARTMVTFKKFKKSIELDLPEDFLDSAALMAWIYLRLQKKLPQKQAFEITRACMLVTGLSVQQAGFRNVEKERTFENLIKNQQRINREGTTRLNTMKILEQSDKKYEFIITRCLFFELFSYLKVPELTSVICSIDNAIFNSYLPEEIIFHRNGLNKTMPAGAKECRFVVEKKG